MGLQAASARSELGLVAGRSRQPGTVERLPRRGGDLGARDLPALRPLGPHWPCTAPSMPQSSPVLKGRSVPQVFVYSIPGATMDH